MNIFTSFFKRDARKQIPREKVLHDLMMRESQLAEGIFGEITPGGKRQFFCLDTNTWIWHEEWTGKSGEKRKITTKYLVRDREIVKSQNGGAYHRLTIEEAENFKNATKAYLKVVKKGLYNQPAAA